MIAMEDWASVMHPQITKVLDRPSASTAVAFDRDSDVLQGFISADSSQPMRHVFYLYVKEPYRRTGIARGLFAAVAIDPLVPFTYACRTAVVGWLSSKIPFAKHDHLRARFPEGATQWPT